MVALFNLIYSETFDIIYIESEENMEAKRLIAKNLKETIVNWCCGDPDEFESRNANSCQNGHKLFSQLHLWKSRNKIYPWKVEVRKR
jgi:hypothetical protein